MYDHTTPTATQIAAPLGADGLALAGRPDPVEFGLVATDLYRDIHKGIRAELFGVTGEAGSLDPADRTGRAALAEHVRSVVDVLVDHAAHEDGAVQPVLEEQLPVLAGLVESDHHALEDRMVTLREMADGAVDAPDSLQRAHVHHVYLELASFSAAYLRHQDMEERVILPALESAVGPDEVLTIHRAIVSSIPPAQMAQSLAFMLPAMNVDDRTELLGGVRAGAPAAVFDGVWSLVGSVLRPADVRAVAARLGVAA
jgi:hypothetical protein